MLRNDRPLAAHSPFYASASQRTSPTTLLNMRALQVFVLPVLARSGLMLSACEGPNEKAGKARDRAAATAGSSYAGEGPAERIGKAQDRAAKAASDARNAEANSLRRQADAVRAGADVKADRLEQQAQSVRDAAKRRAAPLEAQAKRVRER